MLGKGLKDLMTGTVDPRVTAEHTSRVDCGRTSPGEEEAES